MRVVKIGGRAQADPRLASLLRAAWDAGRGELCVVHGGGDEISAMQRAMGREAAFVGGRRVTSEGDLELLRMVLSGLVNKRLVNTLVAAGLPAVGISGEDGGLIGAAVIDVASLGFAGEPVTVKADLLRTLLNAGYLPVISPVAYDATGPAGGPLNVNGDDAAAAIAAALDAGELLLIADVEGVLDGEGYIVSNLNTETARELAASGIAAGGMAAKLESAEAALTAGVTRVRICDLAGLGDAGRGTTITQSQSAVL
jgi:acetylglutamate kinase